MSDTTTESSTNVSQLRELVPTPSGRYLTAQQMQLVYDGRSDYSIGTLTLEGHDWTATDRGPLEDIMISQAFTTLLQGPRETIRHLKLIHYNFGSLDNLAKLIAFFPSLKTLYLEGCSWGFTSTEQVSGHNYSKLPAIPFSLRLLDVKIEALYKPHLIFNTLALATWISTTSTDRHAYEVSLTMPFPLTSSQLEYREAIARILSNFGSKLTQANFEITEYLSRPPIRGKYESPCPYPDFSKNRNLRQLNLNTATSLSRMLFTSTLHTVNQSKLRRLGLSCEHWTSEDLWLELLEPDQGLLQWLSSTDAFIALNTIHLYLCPSSDESYFDRARMWEIMRKQARALQELKRCYVSCGLDGNKKENFWGLPLVYFYHINEDKTESGGVVVEEEIKIGKAANSLLDLLKRRVARDVYFVF